MKFDDLKNLGGQLANQALKTSAEVASDLSDKAIRAGIDQALHAFRLAIERLENSPDLRVTRTILGASIGLSLVQLNIQVEVPLSPRESKGEKLEGPAAGELGSQLPP